MNEQEIIAPEGHGHLSRLGRRLAAADRRRLERL
jgi:hypothetical protein